MKTKSISALLFASVLLFNVGCEDNDSTEPRSPEDLVITNIRQLGTPLKIPLIPKSAMTCRIFTR